MTKLFNFKLCLAFSNKVGEKIVGTAFWLGIFREELVCTHPRHMSGIRGQTMYVVVGTPPLKRKISNYPPPRKIWLVGSYPPPSRERSERRKFFGWHFFFFCNRQKRICPIFLFLQLPKKKFGHVFLPDILGVDVFFLITRKILDCVQLRKVPSP